MPWPARQQSASAGVEKVTATARAAKMWRSENVEVRVMFGLLSFSQKQAADRERPDLDFG
jgi:hypothetical protein